MPEKGETVKLTILAAIVLTILGTSHAIACEVEDLRWEYVSKIKSLQIEGGTTCEVGEIAIRAYDKKGGKRKFIGATNTAFTNTVIQVIYRAGKYSPR